MRTSIGIIALGLALSGCAAPRAESHSTVGVIQSVRSDGKGMVISHEDFPGWMEGMTMPFELADPALAKGLKPGDKVRFTLTQKGDAWPITSIEKAP